MKRHLGIDYGTKRIGLALSDGTGHFAFPKAVVERRWKVLMPYLRRLICDEEIGGIVLGLPQGFDGQETKMTGEVRRFAIKLEETFALPVELENEVLSTKAAQRGPTKKEMIDAAAAALILQGYLDRVSKL